METTTFCNFYLPEMPGFSGVPGIPFIPSNPSNPGIPQGAFDLSSIEGSEAVVQCVRNEQLSTPIFANPITLSTTQTVKVPKIHNVVSTVQLGCTLPLKDIAMRARNAENNPKRFPGLTMRIREPKTTARIFANGKMVCMGAKSENDSRLAARKFARIIKKLGYPVQFKDFKILNIVGSCKVGFKISLEKLNYNHYKFSQYEPEIGFPGLVYRMHKPKIVLVLTGAKSRAEIYKAFVNIYPILLDYKIKQASDGYL